MAPRGVENPALCRLPEVKEATPMKTASRRTSRPGALLALGGALAAAGVSAQPAASAPPVAPDRGAVAEAARPVHAITGFVVIGDNPLSSGETSAILAPFVRSDATLAVLQQAQAALEKSLHDRGYSLYRVLLAQQPISETVAFTVVRSKLEKVEIQGNDKHFDDQNIHHALPELQEGGSTNLRLLARQTSLANQNPSRHVQVALNQGEQGDSVRATVRVDERRPWSVAAGFNNNGTEAAENDRVGVTGSHHNLFDAGHLVGGAYTTSLTHPDRVQQVGLTYRAPIPSWGGMAFLRFVHSDVVGSFGVDAANEGLTSYDSTADSRIWRLGYSHFLVPSGRYHSHLTIAVEDRLYLPTETEPVPASQERRARPLSLAYLGWLEDDGRRHTTYNLEFAFNMGGGSSSKLDNYRSEDPEITSVHWTMLRGSASHAAEMPSGWQFLSRLLAQYSPQLLLAGDAFGLGGVGSVRGAPDRAIYGDTGLSVTLEGATPALAPGLRLAAFVDAGVTNSDVDDKDSRKSRDHLASVGLGLRYVHPVGLNLSADYGYILVGSRATQPDGPNPIPQRGDDKLHVSLSYVF